MEAMKQSREDVSEGEHYVVGDSPYNALWIGRAQLRNFIG